jgi:hypothetical protein
MKKGKNAEGMTKLYHHFVVWFAVDSDAIIFTTLRD